MRVALDTNVLAYADGMNGAAMKNAALELLTKLPVSSVLVPAQVLAELFNVLVRKDKQAPSRARETVSRWSERYAIVETSSYVVTSAADLAVRHRISIWDSIVLSSAAAAGCAALASEDLQDGFSWRGVTVVNPFARPKNALLSSILGEAP